MTTYYQAVAANQENIKPVPETMTNYERLKDLQNQMNNLKAEIGDAEFKEIASHEAWAKRCSRRSAEYRRIRHGCQSSLIPPQPIWDKDLDDYHSTEEYSVPLPEELHSAGYRAFLLRSSDWTWNGYCELPPDHPWVGNKELSGSFFYDHIFEPPLPEHCPQEITYSRFNAFKDPPDLEDDEAWNAAIADSKKFRVGYDHCHGHDISPCRPNSTAYGYITFSAAVAEVTAFAFWFRDCATHIQTNTQCCRKRYPEASIDE